MKSGDELRERYRLEEVVGRGGMGEVWRAWDLLLSRRVAVKLLPAGLRSDSGRQERFRREVQISASLQHPGIATVFDAGEHDDLLFFVMEYLAGDELAALLRRSRAGLPIDEVLTIAADLADALASAHEQGIVHRDIKPGNIMILPSGRAKICDFGIARVMETRRTETATAGVGTAAYMAPEQFEGRVDERSDLYSLGCVLYEMSTGDRPFIGTNVQLMYKHQQEPPEAPDSIRTDLPVELNDLVLHLLEKNGEDRPPTARQVLERLRRIQRGLEDPVKPVIVAAAPSAGEPDVESQPDRLKSETDKRYELPSLALLGSGSPVRSRTKANERMRQAIQEVLDRSETAARVGRIARGPITSLYEVRLEPMTDAAAVLRLAGPISNVLDGAEVRPIPSVRSSSPLPETSSVGFEIPNSDRDMVSLGDVLRSDPEPLDGTRLRAGLGRGLDGHALVELVRLPHLLIAGRPGAGKSVALRSILTSFLMQATPAELGIVLIGSEQAGFNVYEGLPHLIAPLITDPMQATAMLGWVEHEMDRRYDDLQASDCRTVDDYNEAVRQGRLPAPVVRLGGQRLPHPRLVVVIDELADLMAVGRQETEAQVARTAQLARAVGIHLVVATRQTTDRVLTDRLRADILSRLAMQTSDVPDSELILDESGAERLCARGDALFLLKGDAQPRRLQCAYVSDQEVEAVVDHWRHRL